ncbi:hypothetical protein JR316_0011477 [Psilocybe cubensis]|uniref:Uncharacterized protein n=2 Tax=Psilocybe cubensis TaxID=181762 RepID=A0ACB8GL22_PSICU|nr:hypothetical protein JR316_0011477 [Psilocybe cubensis]KAH9475916.1 hypothetical protein JR316_0011477 [Psilocybe cubensis]
MSVSSNTIVLQPLVAEIHNDTLLTLGLALNDGNRLAPIFSQYGKIPHVLRDLDESVHKFVTLCLANPALPKMPQSPAFEVVFGICKTIQQLCHGATPEALSTEVSASLSVKPGNVLSVGNSSTGGGATPGERMEPSRHKQEDEVTRYDLILFILQLIDGMQAMSVDNDGPSQIAIPTTIVDSSTPGASQLGSSSVLSKGKGTNKRPETVLLDYEAAGVSSSEPALQKACRYANKRVRSKEAKSMTTLGFSPKNLSVDHALYNLYKEKAD